MKVAHITTVHPRKDIRIFHKECLSLSCEGHDVILLVNDGLGTERCNGVLIKDLGGSSCRMSRMIVGLPKATVHAIKLKSDVYHFHDPELMVTGFILSLLGKNVIYDVHEDVPNNILNKKWIRKPLRRTISSVVARIERACSQRFSGCVVTTPHINERFLSYGAKSIVVRNYPGRPEKEISPADRSTDSFKLCYAGLIAEDRGIRQMVSIAGKSKTRLNLMGRFQDALLLAELESSPAWNWVDYKGVLTKQEVENCYLDSHVGLAILHPDINYINSLPIKMFEYMMFGLPVICSNFPNWNEIVVGTNSGKSVDPFDETAIVSVIREMKADSGLVNEMSTNGSLAVREQFNWNTEFKLLNKLYMSIQGEL